MSLPTLNENLNIHQSLPDKPALNAEELKQEFDKAPNLIKEYLNGTLLPQIDTLMVNLQNKDISLETALNTTNSIVNQAVNTLSGLKNGATTKISSGTSVPASLADGEIYLQYF